MYGCLESFERLRSQQRSSMKSHADIGTALAVILSIGIASAQTLPPTSVDSLVSAARNAAGLDWPGTFLRLCIVPPPATSGVAPAAAAAPARPPVKDTWYAEPAKVADNFYFLGTKIHSAWALVGSEGIIILEALYDKRPGTVDLGAEEVEVVRDLGGLGIPRVLYGWASRGGGSRGGDSRSRGRRHEAEAQECTRPVEARSNPGGGNETVNACWWNGFRRC